VPAGRFALQCTFSLDRFGEDRALENGTPSKTGPPRAAKALWIAKRTHDGSRSLIRVVKASWGQTKGIEIAVIAWTPWGHDTAL
jgi:hypothetical protein